MSNGSSLHHPGGSVDEALGVDATLGTRVGRSAPRLGSREDHG